jgi:acetyl esterase/lipase
LYLRGCDKGKVPIYASPSRCTEYEGLPPAYTYVGDAEPFYCETVTYIQKLKDAGIPAKLDIYSGGYHAFDMMEPDNEAAKQASERLCEIFRYASEHYFAPQTQKA